MNDEDWSDALHEGVSVDFAFAGPRKPTHADLMTLAPFEQADDYFGICNASDEGDDVVVWLYPMLDGQVVEHEGGPYDGIRLEYCVLRNPVERADTFFAEVSRMTGRFGVPAFYRLRAATLGVPADVSTLREDVGAIVAHWRGQGIEPGSDEALDVEY